MKINRSILTAALLAFTGSAALALTVPVQQDTTATSGKFLKGAGSGATLSVNSKQAAYIQFALGDLPTVPSTITGGNITSANLRIFVGKAKVAGALELHAVTASWSEGAVGAAPAIDPTVIATFPANLIATKDFVTVDVTAAIKAAIGAGDNGFAITAAGTTKVTLGSKEGAASGYPCELNIETNYADDGTGGGVFTGGGTFGGSVLVDNANNNDGNLSGALLFGSEALEGIGSKRTSGGNQFGLDFYTDGGNRMSITSNGNVGIGTGTNSLISRLTLGGETAPYPRAFTILPTSGIDTDGLSRRAALNLDNWGLIQDVAGNGTKDFAIYDDAAQTQRFYIGTNGFVGMGTTTPGYALEVASPLATQLAIRSDSANGRVYTLQSSNGGAALGDGAFQIVDRTAVAARLVIDKTGNVGIGAYPAATAKLDVRGDVKLGSTGQFFAPGGQENLRIIRGFIINNATIGKGAGFTVARKAGAPVGHFVITFTTPFTDLPTITVSPNAAVANVTAVLPNFDTNFCEVQIYAGAALADGNFNFIAIGPR